MAKERKHVETDAELLRRTIASRDKEEEHAKHDAMAAALLDLRHASAESTPAHNRSPRWKQAIAKADEILNSHFNPAPKE